MLAGLMRFIFFHNKRHPAEMAEAEIAHFLSSLASDSHVSASTQNQALNALLFLYHEVLEKNLGHVDGVMLGRRPRKLPVVLTREEVRYILGQLEGLDWIMAMLLLWGRSPPDGAPEAPGQAHRLLHRPD